MLHCRNWALATLICTICIGLSRAAGLGVRRAALRNHHELQADISSGNYIDYIDTWGAMSLLVEKGKTRHIGVSNFSPAQMEDLLNHTSHVPAVHQMEYALLH